MLSNITFWMFGIVISVYHIIHSIRGSTWVHPTVSALTLSSTDDHNEFLLIESNPLSIICNKCLFENVGVRNIVHFY